MTKTRLPLLNSSVDDCRLNRTINYPGQDRAIVFCVRFFIREFCLLRASTDDSCSLLHSQAALTRMMALMTRATELALGFISQPDALGATAEEVKFESGGFDDGMDDDVADADTMDDDTTDSCDLAPRAQIITTACWLTVKEISLLTGEVTGATATADMLSLDALKSAGERLFNVLFTVKHTGAMEKTRIGTTALCARLMRSNDAALNMLPQQWLDELVTQLRRPGQGVRDRVRRSAGLPYAFMSILLAEPRGQTRAALERVLPQLLDVAAAPDGSESENIPRVHAFNVIRVIFADRDLSVETTAHAARGLEVCIRAFSSPAWETRNAATLAFASLLTKVCGCMNISPRRIRDSYVSSRREVSVVEFFQRFPSLHAYLLEELATATSMMTAESSLSVSSVHPSLYPTLALLSRLTPSSSSCDNEGNDAHAAINVKLSPSAFIPSVLTCASAKYLAVRAAAARALRPLVPPTEVAMHIASVLSPLSDAHEPPRVACNTAHGALLCVHELLIEACCSSSSSSAMMWDVFRAASNGLTACAKTAATVRVPLISAAWLRCAEATALIANTFLVNTDACDALGDDGTFHELVLMMWQCSAPVLSAHAEHHPGASEWNKAAAGIRVRIALNCDSAYREYRYARLCKTHDEWFGADIGDVTEAIIDALGANTPYEYRAQAYKALFHGGDHLPMADETKDFVRNALQHEERHSVVRRAIRVVTEWALGMSEGGDHHLLFWRIVLDVTVNNINERVRSEGMCCLARLCAAQLRIDALETVSSGRLNGFVRMILDGCDPSASSEKRKAAVQALSSSKLLDFVQGNRVKDEATGALAVDLWRCMLMLIEDEDVDIREIASETASSAIESVRSGAQSEEVLRAIFQHVHTNFAQFEVAMAFMVDLTKGLSYTRSQFDHVLARSTNIRRLFDKEADNAHAEPLFLAQLAAKQMHASCDAKTAQCALDEVMETLTNMKDALEAFASRDSRWVGGVTAHEDCFVPIANALIGAWAFEARIGDDDKERRDRLQALYTALTPFVAPALRVLMRVSDVNADDVFASVSPCFLV